MARGKGDRLINQITQSSSTQAKDINKDKDRTARYLRKENKITEKIAQSNSCNSSASTEQDPVNDDVILTNVGQTSERSIKKRTIQEDDNEHYGYKNQDVNPIKQTQMEKTPRQGRVPETAENLDSSSSSSGEDYEIDIKSNKSNKRKRSKHSSKGSGSNELKNYFLDCLAARFIATRAEASSLNIVEEVIKSVTSKEQRADYKLINDLVDSGLTSLNNWRYQFLKNIKSLVSSYEDKTVSEGNIGIPKLKTLMDLVNDDKIKKCFHRSFSVIDEKFLDLKPDDTVSVRTALKNVIANAMLIWLKHTLKKDYLEKEDAHRAIHLLDSLTPPEFVPKVEYISCRTKRPHRNNKAKPITKVVFIYSDGYESFRET